MIRKLLAAALLTLSAGAAHATCTLPYTLLPNTVADATKVMADLNALNSCINAVLVPPFTWTAPFPSAPGSTPVDIITLNVGGYPDGVEMPAGTVQGFVSKMRIPSTYTQTPWPPAAISAYVLSANNAAAQSAVAFFGFSGQLVSGVDPYGMNALVTNCAILVCVDGNGFDGNWLAAEADVNVVLKSGSVTPTGIARGFYVAGGSTVDPTGGSFAYTGGSFGANLPWDNFYHSPDAAASIGLNLGAVATGNSKASQSIVLHNKGSAGADEPTVINADANGNILVTMKAGSSFGIDGHYANTSGAPSLAAGAGCGAGPAFYGSGTDSRGNINPGTGGITSCEVTFHDAYPSAPACTVSYSNTAVVVGVSATATTAITISASGALAQGQILGYKCEG